MHLFKKHACLSIQLPLSKNGHKANSVLMEGGLLVIGNGINGTILGLCLFTLKKF